MPVQLSADYLARIDLQTPAIHILRGPRQVGKSTGLKLLVKRALSDGIEPTAITYLTLDLFEGHRPEVLVEALLELANRSERSVGRRILLLDEVTAVKDWQIAIKTLWDRGTIDRDVVICTGSSAADLARGSAERLPGRRGPGQDFLVLPQDFGAFAKALDRDLPNPPGRNLAALLEPDGRRELERMRSWLPSLQSSLDRYLRFGGLPASVAAAAAGAAEPSQEVQRVVWDSLVREVERRGASIAATTALFERVARSLGSKISWSTIARELEVPLGISHGGNVKRRTDARTVRDYIEFVAANYFLLVLYYWKPDSGSSDLSKDKKIYFGDPLLATITASRTGVIADRSALVENVVALALYRRYEPNDRQAENFAIPERLHVWGTRRGGEIDFVAGPRSGIHAAEVADWSQVDGRKATAPMRALPGRPTAVVTRDQLEFRRTANLIPAALLLWALSG